MPCRSQRESGGDGRKRTRRPGSEEEAGRRGGGGRGRSGQGSAWTWAPTVPDQELPLEASQLVDQVMAPRRSG